MKKVSIFLCSILLALGILTTVEGPAQAIIIGPDFVMQTSEFSASGAYHAQDLIAFQSFDPALGTLDRVNIKLEGLLTVQGAEEGNIVGYTPGGMPIYIPYPYTITTTFDTESARGFEFTTPAEFSFIGTSGGVPGDSISHMMWFIMNISFDAGTDILGYTFPSISGDYVPPTSIIGTRDDFLPIIPVVDPPIEILMLFDLENTRTLVPQTTVEGVAFIDYYFTPTSQASEPVPEPATMLLLGSGLIGLAGLRRKFKKG